MRNAVVTRARWSFLRRVDGRASRAMHASWCDLAPPRSQLRLTKRRQLRARELLVDRAPQEAHLSPRIPLLCQQSLAPKVVGDVDRVSDVADG